MRTRSSILFAILLVLGLPLMLSAEPFSIVGPRAVGMGGASVAAVNDSTAVYWNPAALADFRKVDIRVPVDAAGQDHMGLKEKWSRINDIFSQVKAHDPAAINEMISLMKDLDKPYTGTDIDASTGLLISIPAGRVVLALSDLGFGYAGIYPTIDRIHLSPNPDVPVGTNPNFVVYNNSAVTGIGLTATEPALSLSTSFSRKLFVGINAKMIYANSYVSSQTLTTGTFHDFVDDFKNSRTRSREASVDAGILYAPANTFSIGIVGRDLNGPTFPVQGSVAKKLSSGEITTEKITEEIKFEPQCRAGLAWHPYKTFTLAADYDLTRNKLLLPATKAR